MVRENHQENQKYLKAFVVLVLIGLGFCLTYVLSEFSTLKDKERFEEGVNECFKDILGKIEDMKCKHNVEEGGLLESQMDFFKCVNSSMKIYFNYLLNSTRI